MQCVDVHHRRGSRPQPYRLASVSLYIMDIVHPVAQYGCVYRMFAALAGRSDFLVTDGPMLVVWTGNHQELKHFSTCCRWTRTIWSIQCAGCNKIHVQHFRSMELARNSLGALDHWATGLSWCFMCQMANNQRVSKSSRENHNFQWCSRCKCWIWALQPHWHQLEVGP